MHIGSVCGIAGLNDKSIPAVTPLAHWDTIALGFSGFMFDIYPQILIGRLYKESACNLLPVNLKPEDIFISIRQSAAHGHIILKIIRLLIAVIDFLFIFNDRFKGIVRRKEHCFFHHFCFCRFRKNLQAQQRNRKTYRQPDADDSDSLNAHPDPNLSGISPN